MKIGELLEFSPQGIWRIEDAYPEKNAHRVGRHVVFPWMLQSNANVAKWIYVNYDNSLDKKAGWLCSTSLIKCIQYLPQCGSLQISTKNSQYVFNKVM